MAIAAVLRLHLDRSKLAMLQGLFDANTIPPSTVVERYEILPGALKVTPSSGVVIYSAPTEVTGRGSGTLQFDTRTSGPVRLYAPIPDDAEVNVDDATICCDAAQVQNVPIPSDFGHLIAIDVDTVPPVVWDSATGLRNPFGFSVDRGQSGTGIGEGDVWIGDTGWKDTGSVIRWTPSGAYRNYGWPWSTGDGDEPWLTGPATVSTFCGVPPVGTMPTQCNEPANPTGYTTPYSVFSDFDEFNGTRDALIGGYAYRQDSVPALTDRFVFATYGTRRVYSLPTTGATGIAPINLTASLGTQNWGNSTTIHALGEDAKGELYIVRVDQSSSILSNGAIFQITL